MAGKAWAKPAGVWGLAWVLLFFVVAWTANVAPASAGAPSDLVTRVSVTGSASVLMESNEAVINAEILARGETSIEAQAGANGVYEAVAAALKELGIKHEAGHYSLFPYWEYRGEQGSVRAGYEARRQLSVYVDDVARVGEAVDRLLAAGVNAIYGVEYTLSEKERVEEEVLAAALRDAQRKVEVVAAQLGMRVLAVETVNVGQANAYPMARAALFEAASPSMAPSPVSIDATVSVTYLLVPAE